MGLALTVVAAVALTAVLVYLRYVARRHVATLFRSTARALIAEGASVEIALQKAVSRLVRRIPFNRIQEDEMAFFLCVLQDLGLPVEVGATILQQCEIKKDVTELRDQREIARLAYWTDFKLNLHKLIQDARILHKKASDRYPNITVALLASLSAREGWAFIEDQSEALVFGYHQKTVRLPKQGSGKDAAKIILFEEMARRPLLARPDLGFEARQAARRNLIDNFDSLFDEVLQNAAT
jgi:hypothetical protein